MQKCVGLRNRRLLQLFRLKPRNPRDQWQNDLVAPNRRITNDKPICALLGMANNCDMIIDVCGNAINEWE